MSVVKEFGADSDLKKLYQAYLAIVLLGGFLWWMIPVLAFVVLVWMAIGFLVAISLFGSLLVVVGFALYWIGRFHSSLTYILEDDKLTVTKGVWWKTKSFVPYNRITNVNIYQGPVSRYFGLGKLSIQTAGFSGTSARGGRVSEAEILGVKNFEEVKDVIMERVKGLKPEAIEAGVEPSEDANQEILAELRRIRKALEK